MELRQLRCFIAVAEALHFGKAAQRLNMLPASLGRQIKTLEEDLGVPLLKRTTRAVALTEDGSDFLPAARDILERADRAEEAFRQRRRERATVLNVGSIDSAAAGLIPQLLPHFREAFPEIDIQLMEQKTFRLIPKLLSGRIDVAFIRPPEVLDPRLTFEALLHETPVAAVPKDHPLARRNEIEITDLAGEPMIVPDRQSRRHSHDLTMNMFREAGLNARIAQIAEEKHTIVNMVGSGIGLAIVPRWTGRLASHGIKFIPITNPEGRVQNKLALSAVWLTNTRHDTRDKFIEILQQYLPEIRETA